MCALAGTKSRVTNLSWKLIETPCRSRSVVPIRRFAVIFSAIFVFLVLFGTFGHLNNGYPDRFDKDDINLIQPPKTQNDCGDAFNLNHDFYTCDFGARSSDRKVILYGDSHAASLQSSMHRAFHQSNIRGIRLGKNSDCQILPGVFREAKSARAIKLTARCSENLRAALKTLGHVDAVVVAIRWSALLAPIEGSILSSVFDNGEGGIELEKESKYMALNRRKEPDFGAPAKRRAVFSALDTITGSGRKTILIYPVPEVGWDVPRQNLKRFKSGKSVDDSITTSYQRYLERNAFITKALDEFGNSTVFRIRPSELLCDTFVEERCITALDRKALYYDDNHLSDFGADLVVEKVQNTLDSLAN